MKKTGTQIFCARKVLILTSDITLPLHDKIYSYMCDIKISTTIIKTYSLYKMWRSSGPFNQKTVIFRWI
jgi:hypothetical protein